MSAYVEISMSAYVLVSLSLQYAALQLLGEERLLRKNGLDEGKEKQGKSDSAYTTDNGEIETQRAAGERIMVGAEVPGDPSGGGEGEGEAENVVPVSDCARAQPWPLARMTPPPPPQQLLDHSHIPSTCAVPIIWSEVQPTLHQEAQLVPTHVRQLSTLSTQQLHVSWGGVLFLG